MKIQSSAILLALLSIVLSSCAPAWRLGPGSDSSGKVIAPTVTIVSAVTSPAVVEYPLHCPPPPADVIIIFTVLVDDPSNIGSENLDVQIRFGFGSLPASSGENFLLEQAGTTGTVHTYTGRDNDPANISITEDPEAVGYSTGGSGNFIWTATVVDNSGRVLAKTGVMEIPFAPFPCPTPMVSALPPLILVPSTSTPASAADCPSGTYYADMTHRCIAIATPTATKRTKCIPDPNKNIICP
jgi:hypothetical protein